MTHLYSNETRGEQRYMKMLFVVLNKSWKQLPENSSCKASYLPSNKPSKSEEQDVLVTNRDVKTNFRARFSYRLLDIDVIFFTDLLVLR